MNSSSGWLTILSVSWKWSMCWRLIYVLLSHLFHRIIYALKFLAVIFRSKKLNCSFLTNCTTHKNDTNVLTFLWFHLTNTFKNFRIMHISRNLYRGYWQLMLWWKKISRGIYSVILCWDRVCAQNTTFYSWILFINKSSLIEYYQTIWIFVEEMHVCVCVCVCNEVNIK